MMYKCFKCNGNSIIGFACVVCDGKGYIELEPYEDYIEKIKNPVCGHCGLEMVCTCVITTNPAQYEYTCNSCGARKIKDGKGNVRPL